MVDKIASVNMILLKIECTLRIKLLVCGFCIEKSVNYACLWQCFEAHCIHLKGYTKKFPNMVIFSRLFLFQDGEN